MSRVIFNYNGTDTDILCNKEDIIEDICKKFCSKIQIDMKSVGFLYGGQPINLELTFEQSLNGADKARNKMNVLLTSIDYKEKSEKDAIIKSKYIICPDCGETCKIKLKNYKIELYECKNCHYIDNIFLNEFEETQKIDLKKVICDNCKEKNQYESFNNQFYKCNSCNQKLCPLCKSVHKQDHFIIKQEQQNFICTNHNKFYNSYCERCKIDLCMLCEKDHKNHKIISYGMIIPNNKELEINSLDLKMAFDILKENIDKIKHMLNNINENLINYYNIYNNLIKNFDNVNVKYDVIYNINELNKINNEILNDLNDINSDDNYNNQFKKL